MRGDGQNAAYEAEFPEVDPITLKRIRERAEADLRAGASVPLPPLLAPPKLCSPPKHRPNTVGWIFAVAFGFTVLFAPWRWQVRGQFGSSGIEFAPLWATPSNAELYLPLLLCEWVVLAVLCVAITRLRR